MSAPKTVDPRLVEFAAPRQRQIIETINKVGSYANAARVLGISSGNVGDAVRTVQRRAAVQGYSPDHDLTQPIAPGYTGRGHSTLYIPNKETGELEVRAQWVKTKADDDARARIIEQAFDSAAAVLPRVPPIKKPGGSMSSLANLYTITDFHLGMYAWSAEGGAAWDLEIAEKTMLAAFEAMVTNAPPAAKAVINIQGDFLHTNGPEPTTPAHHNVLDASGRYGEMVDAAIRVMRRVCDLALYRHAQVEVIFAEGNHDPDGSMWLRKMFAAIYEREPRLKVNASELPFYVVQHGQVMLLIHHGHKVKNEQLPLLAAAQFPVVWGATTKRFAHCGHRHHAEEKEYSGMTVIQHPTLAARDAYAARGGWIAERAATCITYHETFGQVARTFVTPEMLAA